MTQRLQYNIGRLQKEGGLRKYTKCNTIDIKIFILFVCYVELDRMGSKMTNDIAYL